MNDDGNELYEYAGWLELIKNEIEAGDRYESVLELPLHDPRAFLYECLGFGDWNIVERNPPYCRVYELGSDDLWYDSQDREDLP